MVGGCQLWMGEVLLLPHTFIQVVKKASLRPNSATYANLIDRQAQDSHAA